MPALAAEDYFETELYHFKHNKAPTTATETLIRANAPYHLPDCLAKHVNFVENMLRFPKISFQPIIKDEEEETIFGEDGDEFDSCGKVSSEAMPMPSASRSCDIYRRTTPLCCP